MKKEIYTAVEINDTHAKLLQAKLLRGKKILSACDIRPFRSMADEEMTKLLTEILLSRNVQADHLVFVIPRRFVILKLLKLPSHNEGEIGKMVGLQLVNNIPYSLEEIIYEYQILEKDTSGYTQVIVYVVQRDIVHRYMKICKKIGIPLGMLSVSSFGIVEWFNQLSEKNKMNVHVPVCLMNIDVNHSEICFCYDRKLIFSRNISYGARDINADSLVEIVNQISLSLSTYEREKMGPSVRKIVLISSLAEAQQLKSRCEQEIKISTDVLKPLDFVLSQKKIDLSSMAREPGVSLTVGLGALLADSKKMVNLMPPEVHDTKREKIQRRQLAQFFSLFFLTGALLLAFLGLDLHESRSRLVELEEEVKQKKTEVRDAKQRIEFVKFFNQEFANRVFFPDVILELTQLLPDEISFRSISFDATGGLTLQGFAQTSTSVNTLQSALVQSPVFKDVNLQFATKRKIFNTDVTDFKINAQLIGVRTKQ